MNRVSKRKGNTLIAVLGSVVIILVLVVVMMYGGFGPNSSMKKDLGSREDGKGTTVPGMVRYKALDTTCKSDLDQIRAMLMTARTSSDDDKFPASLSDLHLPANMYQCPIAPHEPYNYDPTTGVVSCPHPGHEKY